MRKFLVYVFLSLPYFLFSQEYPVKTYTIHDGLPQMQIMSTFLDSRGYLWVGTKFGIAKFNGQKFTNYPPIDDILGVETHEFAEDRAGNIYYNSLKYLGKFDGQKFSRVKGPAGDYDSFTFNNKNELVAIINYQLYIQNNKDSLVAANWPILNGKKCAALSYHKPSNSYFITLNDNELYSISKNKLVKIYANKENGFSLFANGSSKNIMKNYAGNKGNYYFIDDSLKVIPIINIVNQSIEVLNPIENNLFFVWQGIGYVLEKKSKKVTKVFSNNEMAVEPHASYNASGIWICSEQGLKYIFTNGFKYFDKAINPYTWSVSEDKNNHIWFWNYGSPVKRWDGNQFFEEQKMIPTIRETTLKIQNHRQGTDINWWYFGSLLDKYGKQWHSFVSGPIFDDNGKYKIFLNKLLEKSSSFSLLEDTTRNLILSGGKNSIDIIENKPPYKLRTIGREANMNVGRYVLAMALEKPGVYWLAGGNMLSRYELDTKKSNEFSVDNGRSSSRIFVDLMFDNRRTLWAVSGLKGLFYYDSKKDSLINMPHAQLQKPMAYVGQYDKDHLLLGGMRELFIFDLTAWYKNGSINIKAFNHNNGYIGMEAGQHGFFKDSKGRIFLPSGTVLSMIEPDKLEINTDTLHTYFTKFNQELLPFRQKNIRLVAAGDVRIEFEAVGENRSFTTQYSYQLNGKEWSAWQDEPVVTFNKLAFGNYTLKVRSSTANGDILLSEQARLDFLVRIFPWQSPNFPIYSFVGISFLLAGFWTYWSRQKQKEFLVTKELAKREIQFHQQSMKEQSQSLKMKTLQLQTAKAQLNPHFASNALASIQKLIYGNDLKLADENLVKLGKLLRNYLDVSRTTEIDPNSLEKAMITLEKEIEMLKLYASFESQKYNNQIIFKFKVQDDLPIDFLRLPPLLIQPFVENAIMHGTVPNLPIEGIIEISFEINEAEKLCCTITDNGIGREEAALRNRDKNEVHKSHGTDLVHQQISLLADLGFTIELVTSNNKPNGTIVKLVFPGK